MTVYTEKDLCSWPEHQLNNFKLQNCIFGANDIVKNNDKSKYVYSDYGIAFDGLCSFVFGYNFSKNVIVSGASNSSSSHSDNHKNDFLVLSEGTTKILALTLLK